MEQYRIRLTKSDYGRSCFLIEILREEPFIVADDNGEKQLKFLDNVNAHDLKDEFEVLVEEINTLLFYLPPNTTLKVQHLDTGMLKLFKNPLRKF